MGEKNIKIALTGPESVGKSTLSKQLATHFKTVNTIEFARNFLEERKNKYTYNDILFMAKEQLLIENKMILRANNFLFCDTDFINFKIWLEYENLIVPEWLENHIQSQPYYLSILLKPDIPWEEDVLRGFPHKREYFYDLFKEKLNKYRYNYVEIGGTGEERVKKAIKVVEDLKSRC